MAEPQYRAPWGHSGASHRVHGFCADCPESSAEAELVAWRQHERARYEVTKQAVTAPPRAGFTTAAQRLCHDCGREALTVVTASFSSDEGTKTAGGWALCLHCHATPHPTYRGPEAAPIDRVRALHTEEHGCCAHCTRAAAVLYPCPTIEALEEPQEAARG